MQLFLSSISEPTTPGHKWAKLFHTYWPAYQSWLHSKKDYNAPDLQEAESALKKFMPEMWSTYQQICKLVNADDEAARFLTGFQPPAYISACSQAVNTNGESILIRNYDFHPDLIEGTLLFSAWNGKKVIANSDCLIGVLDGMNEDGLCISLAFGGRKEVGVGFGIPFILRYVLEFCSTTEEVVAVLRKVPSHMSYNVTVLDRSGIFKTVEMAPDKAIKITDSKFATNHQGTIDWPENARFNKTIERSEFLGIQLRNSSLNGNALGKLFLSPPLYSKQHELGIGTLYTSVYKPESGTMEMLWKNDQMLQSFDNFQEQDKLIIFNPEVSLDSEIPQREDDFQSTIHPASVLERQEVQKKSNSRTKTKTKSGKKKTLKSGRNGDKNPQLNSWKDIANYWTDLGRFYWKKWSN